MCLVACVVVVGLVGCGGGKTKAPATTGASIPPPGIQDMLRDEARREFRATHYIGIGSATATSERAATSTSIASAQSQLAGQIEAAIKNVFDELSMTTLQNVTLTGTVENISRHVEQTLRGAEIEKTRTVSENGKFTVFSVVIVLKEPVEKALENAISNEQALTDAAVTGAVMDMIRAQLNR